MGELEEGAERREEAMELNCEEGAERVEELKDTK
jgi:hypothetical protein